MSASASIVVAPREEVVSRPEPPAPSSSRWRSPVLVPGVILGLAGLVLVWTHVLPLTQGAWADEVVTTVLFARPGPSGIWHHYFANDHMFFELLAWITNGITGDHGAAAYRFWGVMPALGAVGLLASWLWRRVDPWVAAIFAVLATASPLYLVLGSEERGYGLGFLAGVLILIAADWFIRTRGARGALVLFALGALIGVWTLPVFVLPVAATGAVMLVAVRPAWRRLVIAGGAVALGSLLFYAPVLSEVLHASKQPYGTPLPWHAFVTGPFRDLLAPEVLALAHGTRTAVDALGPGTYGVVAGTTGLAMVVAIVVVVAGFAAGIRGRGRFLALAALVPAIATYTLLDLIGMKTANRFASFLLLPLLALAAMAFVAAGRALARLPRGGVVAAAAAVVLSLFVFARADALVRVVLTTPYENDQEVAELATGVGASSVLTNYKAGDLFFYLGPRVPAASNPAQLEALFCSRAGPFLYLDELTRAAPQPPTRCLRARGAVEIPVSQRHFSSARIGHLPRAAAGSPFVAWLVPGPSSASSAAPASGSATGGTVCTPKLRASVAHAGSTAHPGQPLPVQLPATVAGQAVSTQVTVTKALLKRSISGFGAPGGFVVVEYRVRNAGSIPIVPVRTIDAVMTISADFKGSVAQAGTADPSCRPLAADFARSQGLADPHARVAPGAGTRTVAVYPLPALTTVTPYVLGWVAPKKFLAGHFALPVQASAHG